MGRTKAARQADGRAGRQVGPRRLSNPAKSFLQTEPFIGMTERLALAGVYLLRPKKASLMTPNHN